jgi:hypothetical protein
LYGAPSEFSVAVSEPYWPADAGAGFVGDVSIPSLAFDIAPAVLLVVEPMAGFSTPVAGLSLVGAGLVGLGGLAFVDWAKALALMTRAAAAPRRIVLVMWLRLPECVISALQAVRFRTGENQCRGQRLFGCAPCVFHTSRFQERGYLSLGEEIFLTGRPISLAVARGRCRLVKQQRGASTPRFERGALE